MTSGVDTGIEYTIGGKDELSETMGAVEKSMSDFFTSMRKHLKGLDTVQDQVNDTVEDAVDNAEDQLEQGGKLIKMKDKFVGKLKQEYSALKNVLGISSLLGGASVVAGIASMVKSYLDWEAVTADLNSSMFIHQNLLKESAAIMEGYGKTLGFTQQELQVLARQGLEKNIPNLQEWSREVLNLSKATDLATGQVGDMYLKLQKVYGLGFRPIRNIGSAFKYVADTSAITADQLADFMGNLEPIFARLPGLSGDAKGKLTTDLIGIAGAIGDVFGDPQKISGMFAEMLDPLSEQGKQMVGMMSQLTGQTADVIKARMQAGDLQGVFKDFVVNLNQMTDPNQLLAWSHQAKEVFGFEFVDIKKLQELGKEHGKFFDESIKKAREAAAQQTIAEDAAKARLTEINAIMLELQNLGLKFWRIMGKEMVVVIKDHLPAMRQGLEDLRDWLQGSGPKDIHNLFKTFSVLSDIGGWLKDLIVPSFQRLGKLIGGLAAGFDQIFGGDILDGIKTLGLAIKEFVLSGPAYEAYQTMLGYFSSIGEYIMNIFKTFGRAIKDHVLGGLKATLRPLLGLIDKIPFASRVVSTGVRAFLKEEEKVTEKQGPPKPGIPPMVGPLPPAGAPSVPRLGPPAPPILNVPSPTVNVTPGGDPGVTRALSQQTAILLDIRNALSRPETRKRPGDVLSRASMGG